MDARSLALFALPAVVAGYIVALGYRIDLTSTNAFVFVGALAALGVAGGLAVRDGVRLSIGVSLLALALVPWLGDLGLGPHFLRFEGLAAAVVFVCVGGLVAVALEYAMLNSDRLPDVSRGAVLTSIAVGVGHLLALAVVAVSLGEPVPALDEFGEAIPSEYVMLVLTLLGVVLLGAVPTLSFVRWRLVSPALVVASGFAFVTYRTWRYVQDVVHVGASPSPMIVYAIFWFVPLTVALIGGTLEYRARSGDGRRPGPRSDDESTPRSRI